ncbi:MAG: carboxypeptidase-like regulatory domain-containing protein [Gemmatimonadaceae bacterium]
MNARQWELAPALLLAALAFPLGISNAQTGTLFGLVMRDSLGHELSGAEVTLAGMPRPVLTNSRGGFRVDAVPPGRYGLAIRHVGFRPLTDTIVVVAGQRLEREFVMEEHAQELDSVRVSAPERKYLSPNLQGFEERRKAGRGGYFISDSILRRNDERNVAGVVAANTPGVLIVSAAGYTYLASSRKGGKCWVAVYIDGNRIYDATMGMINRPDFNRFAVREYGAVEYYPGDASLPLQYQNRGSDCGTLLLWTRER